MLFTPFSPAVVVSLPPIFTLVAGEKLGLLVLPHWPAFAKPEQQ
jgi:hypothetical protein